MALKDRPTRALLVALATVGGLPLAVIIATFWMQPNDSLAYWLAGNNLALGRPIYATGEVAFEPYAYHYPPPLAQAIAPISIAFTATAFVIAFRALLLLALWDLAGRRMLALLALIAFIPVAVELRFENVHLLMALGIVLGIRRWPWLFAVGAIVKISPGLGIVYLALRGRWRDAGVATLTGIVIVGVSFILDPGLWQAWLDAVLGRAEMVGNSLIPLPYAGRVAIGLALTVVGGLVGRRRGELLLVGGITIANPGLALNGFAVLAAGIPIWFAGPDGIGTDRRPSGAYGRQSAAVIERRPTTLR